MILHANEGVQIGFFLHPGKQLSYDKIQNGHN